MDHFSFFFAFYGLILGLAATEVLGSFGAFVRVRPLARLEPQIALLALFTFVSIVATWIDAWATLQDATIDFAGLWAPVLIATAYYLAAAVAFPREVAELDRLADYYAERKRFVLGALLAADLLVHFTYVPVYAAALRDHPLQFWGYFLPYTLLLDGMMVATMFIRGRRVSIALLAALSFLFLLPYWHLTMAAEIEALLKG